MKKLLTIILITISLSGVAQKDTIPPDSVAIISVRQINDVLEEMKKAMTIEQLPLYNFLLGQLQAKINEGVIEWRKRIKKPIK